MDKLTAEKFLGAGIAIRADTIGDVREEHGKFAFVTLRDNTVGLQIAPGLAEYNLFTLLSFHGNDTAAVIAAGNNVITASNIVDNAEGIRLRAGTNSGHGIVSATNINHNLRFNVRADNIKNGYTFSGCHIYGDSASAGIIRMRQSRGILFDGGAIDAAIVDIAGGPNVLSNNIIAGPNCSVTGDDDAVKRISNVATANTPAQSSSRLLCMTPGY